MRLGYNTNGLAHHSLPAAIELLAELGYESVAITLDHACLNPFGDRLEQEVREAADLLLAHKMHSVIETGARFLLNPGIKHEPTLVSHDEGDRLRRVDFLKRAIDVAAMLGSDCVSLWSGRPNHSGGRDEAMWQLVLGLRQVVKYAECREMTLGFEPEPEMLITTMRDFDELASRIDSPRFQLTLDVGHLHCNGETPIDGVIHQWADRIVNVHIEDMRRGVHEHLMFGEGDMGFPPIIAALEKSGYHGGVHVELSRHSHEGPTAAKRAMEFLKPLLAT